LGGQIGGNGQYRDRSKRQSEPTCNPKAAEQAALTSKTL